MSGWKSAGRQPNLMKLPGAGTPDRPVVNSPSSGAYRFIVYDELLSWAAIADLIRYIDELADRGKRLFLCRRGRQERSK